MRVLFIPGGLGYGHVSKCLALADELKLLGITDIAFGFGGPDRQIIEDKGYPVFAVHDLTEDRILEKSGGSPTGIQGPKAVFELISDVEFIRKSIDDEIAAIESYQAGLVIYDSRYTGNIAALLKKVPSVSIIQNYLALQPEIISEVIPSPPAAQCLLDLLNHFKTEVNRERVRRGLETVKGIFELFTSDFNMAATIEGFGKIAGRNLPLIDYWGPFIQKRQIEAAEPEWMKKLNPYQKTVYISTGGSRRAKEILPVCLRALEELPEVQGVVSAGTYPLPSDLAALPDRIIVKPFVPGMQMTAKADVVITHGGHSTLMELLYLGVPGLILPFQPEQSLNGRKFEAANAGLVIPSEELESEKLKQYLMELLYNEKYKSGIAKLGRTLDGYPGVAKAAAEIVKLFGASYEEGLKEG
jgi:UDP-N-acetylglucosamine--N-acetylmuramyl-(pentapeptide) pyrophosphoryl-undecaprenol N-acetylglucosamine transferase